MNVASEILCVIPARAGSKGIPGKNLVDFLGRPLLSWSISAAVESKAVGRVIVSTESEVIAQASRALGAETPFLRPAELAEDHVHAVHVVEHALDYLAECEGYEPDAVMLLLPTSPLRSAGDVAAAAELLDCSDAPAVISVVDLGKYLTNLRFLRDNSLVRVAPGEDPNAQRQGLERLYAVNGSIFLARAAALRAAGTFHVEGALGYIMDEVRSVDVNTPHDLELARQMAQVLRIPEADRNAEDALT